MADIIHTKSIQTIAPGDTGTHRVILTGNRKVELAGPKIVIINVTAGSIKVDELNAIDENTPILPSGETKFTIHNDELICNFQDTTGSSSCTIAIG